MATFPLLSTGAVTQYPSGLRIGYGTEVLKFVDGTEQRFRRLKDARRHWIIQAVKMTDEEIEALEEFSREVQFDFGSFTFVDPWDGIEHEDCSLADQVFTTNALGPSRYQSYFVIRKNQP